MKKPKKPIKPRKNQPPPYKTKRNTYSIFSIDDRLVFIEEDKVVSHVRKYFPKKVKKGKTLTYEDAITILYDKGYVVLSNRISKNELEKIVSFGNTFVDFSLREYRGEIELHVEVEKPTSQYNREYKQWKNRFNQYEKDLERYERDLVQYKQWQIEQAKQEFENKLKQIRD